MPQLDTSTFSSQLFWLVVCFLVLYFILSYVALPKISRVLEAREETFEAKINKASTYREEAENLLAEYEASLASAREEAHLHYKTIENATSLKMALKQKEILDKVNHSLHLAEQDLYRARIEAHQELETVTEEIASLIFAKLTGRMYSPDEVKILRKGV